MAKLIIGLVSNRPEHYNARVRANIPEVWEVACDNLAQLLGRGWEDGEVSGSAVKGGSHRMAIGCGTTREEAVQDFIELMKSLFPGGGKVRLTGD